MASHGQLHDSWALTQPEGTSNPATPLDSLRLNGMTCDSPLNSFSAAKPIYGQAKHEFGKRLDYIFFRPSPLARTTVRPLSTQVSFTQLVPGTDYSFSDHFGIEATFTFPPADGAPDLPAIPPVKALQLEQIIAGMQFHAKIAARESRLHLYVFGACVAFGLLVLPVAASFQPLRYLNWIFTYLGVGTGALGATMLYVGFVGGRWEQGGLQVRWLRCKTSTLTDCNRIRSTRSRSSWRPCSADRYAGADVQC
jgi:sphingomyelin phosphodiesterase 2